MYLFINIDFKLKNWYLIYIYLKIFETKLFFKIGIEIIFLINVEYKSIKVFGFVLVDKNIMINKMIMTIMIEISIFVLYLSFVIDVFFIRFSSGRKVSKSVCLNFVFVIYKGVMWNIYIEKKIYWFKMNVYLLLGINIYWFKVDVNLLLDICVLVYS